MKDFMTYFFLSLMSILLLIFLTNMFEGDYTELIVSKELDGIICEYDKPIYIGEKINKLTLQPVTYYKDNKPTYEIYTIDGDGNIVGHINYSELIELVLKGK